MLEDLGFYVVDNLPTSLMPTIVELASQPGGIERLALVSGRQHDDVLPHVAHMRAAGHHVTVVFLDASTPVLVQRYDATRRRHPFADYGGRSARGDRVRARSAAACSASRPTS